MKLWAHLWDRHRIQLGATVRDEFRGLRVSPNIYTTLAELDRSLGRSLHTPSNEGGASSVPRR